MRIYSRCITLGAAAGLALGGASVLAAQQQPRDTASRETGAVTRTDTLSQPGMAADTSRAGMSRDTGAAVRTDTALKAKPGLQTGRARGDSANTGMTPDTATAPSRQVHKKGKGYHYTGAPSDTTLHARPGTQTGKATSDTGKVKHRRRHHGAATDTTKAKPDSTK